MKHLKKFENYSISKQVDDIVQEWWLATRFGDESIFMAWLGDQQSTDNGYIYSIDTRGEEIPQAINDLDNELKSLGYGAATHNVDDGEITIKIKDSAEMLARHGNKPRF